MPKREEIEHLEQVAARDLQHGSQLRVAEANREVGGWKAPDVEAHAVVPVES